MKTTKTYFAWAKPKNSTDKYQQTYLNAVDIKEARVKFNDDFDLDGKVSLAKHK